MSEMGMVERVARALCEDARMNPDDALGGWAHWVPEARVAIATMRNPTAKMRRAACGAMSPGKRPTEKRVSDRAKHAIRWRAMIDAALTEPAPSKPE